MKSNGETAWLTLFSSDILNKLVQRIKILRYQFIIRHFNIEFIFYKTDKFEDSRGIYYSRFEEGITIAERSVIRSEKEVFYYETLDLFPYFQVDPPENIIMPFLPSDSLR